MCAPPSDLAPGTLLLGQFEVLEVCGRGAMGTVYRARQLGMERQVALKILHRELLCDPEIVKRFDREARAVARLQHPNIVTFFLVGTTADAQPFLAMEYVEGKSLADVLEEAPVLETPRALHVARQVCAALSEAHAAGIVHRDLKPANLLLAQKRRLPDFVKVLDFGIAKLLETDDPCGEAVESRLSRTGTIFGTPHYIAPEQAQGGEVDGRADLYSLGVILYRCLTGRLPFEGSGLTVLLAHMGQAVPLPREHVPGLDLEVQALVLRALEKDPARRFQTAEEMADALETLGATLQKVDASVPVRAVVAPPPRQLPRVPLRALGAVLGVGGLALAGMQMVSARPKATEPPSPAPLVVEAAVRADAGTAALEPAVRPGYRVVTVGESGYAVRAQVPADARAGQSYDLIFDVVDPDGTTTDDPELPATLEEPGKKGAAGEKKKVQIPQIGTSGRYVLRETFDEAGRYHVHLFPIADEPKVHIWLDILVKDENGRVPPDPVPVRVARAPRPVDKPPPDDEMPPEKPKEPPAEPALPPIFGSQKMATAGAADSDPYHILDDKGPAPQVRPASVPYWKYRLLRRVRPRPQAPPPPRPPTNPDGLE